MTSIEAKLNELTIYLEDYKLAHRSKFNETNLTDDCEDMRSSNQIIDASEEFFEKYGSIII